MDKFPFTKDLKQQALAISLLRAQHGAKGPPREAPVLAVSELNRIVVFWGQADGRWRSFQRIHKDIGAEPARPSRPDKLAFSRNVALAAAEDGLIAVYKREADGDPTLFLDAAHFDGSTGDYDDKSPGAVAIPLKDLGFRSSGLDIWADWVKGELLILTQTFDETSEAPELTLLASALPSVLDAPGLARANVWQRYTIDKGGFDFDARREGDDLHVVHRRRGGVFSAPAPALDTALQNGGDYTAVFTERHRSPLVFESMFDFTPLVYSQFDLASRSVLASEDRVPGGEHPLIVAVDPLWLVVTRHGGAIVSARAEGDRKTVKVETLPGGGKFIVAQTSGQAQSGWATDRLLDANTSAFPGPLRQVGNAQWLIETGPNEFSFATLFDSNRVQCLGLSRDPRVTKGDLVLLHHDDWLGVLAATRFSLSPASPNGRPMQAVPQGTSVFDVNHAVLHHVRQPSLSANDDELGQFGPVPFEIEANHPDGYKLRYRVFPHIKMGGAPVVDSSAPTAFFAYTDMGDGGVRVILRSDTSLPDFSPPGHPKKFNPSLVSDLGGGKWIELETPEHVPLNLPRYRAPYADFLRGGWNNDREFSFALGLTLFLVPLFSGETFRPRSIVMGAQPALDMLPELSALFLGGALVEPPLPVTLTDAEATLLQATLVNLAPALANQGNTPASPPFALSFAIDHGFLMQGSTYVFTANLPNAAAVASWTFTFRLPGDATSVFTATGTPTQVVVPGNANELTVELSVVSGGNTVVSSKTYSVELSLWANVTSIYSNLAASGGVAFASLSVDIGAFVIDFTVSGGTVSSVLVTYPTSYGGQFRFLDAPEPGQGRVGLRLPLTITASSVTPSGNLAWTAGLVRITDLEVKLRTNQSFTPGVLTSDRRTVDPLQNRTYKSLDRAAERQIRGLPDQETVRRLSPQSGDVFATDFLPAALAMKPADDMQAELIGVDLQATLSSAARNVGVVVTILITLGLAMPLILSLAAVIIATGPLGVLAVASLGLGVAALGALLATAVGFGLGSLLFDVLLPRLLRGAIRDKIRTRINGDLPGIAQELEGGGFGRYTGEGLAEAVAKRTFDQAIADGLAVAPAEGLGRDRFRSQFFRMIVVSEGKAKIEISR